MKPHFWYWTLAFFNVLFSGLVSWFTKENKLDVAVHDTYLVIDQFHIFLFFSMWLFFLGVQLWLLARQRKAFPKWLWRINLLVALLPPWVFFILSNMALSPDRQFEDYAVLKDATTSNYLPMDWINTFLPIVLVMYLFFQIAFTIVFVVRMRKTFK